jgi:hypothetical protein
MSDEITPTPKLRMVQLVLHWVWDPIGVGGVPETADEYDRYAGPVLELLNRAATNAEVADYLTKVEDEWMGLTPNRDRNEDVAALLRELTPLVR